MYFYPLTYDRHNNARQPLPRGPSLPLQRLRSFHFSLTILAERTRGGEAKGVRCDGTENKHGIIVNRVITICPLKRHDGRNAELRLCSIRNARCQIVPSSSSSLLVVLKEEAKWGRRRRRLRMRKSPRTKPQSSAAEKNFQLLKWSSSRAHVHPSSTLVVLTTTQSSVRPERKPTGSQLHCPIVNCGSGFVCFF